MATEPQHDFQAGETIYDRDGNAYVVTDTRFTAVLSQTLGDGPIAYHLGDGSAFSRGVFPFGWEDALPAEKSA